MGNIKKLPFIDDKKLYGAVMLTITYIESGKGKQKSIQLAAKERLVKQVLITPYINEYFPKSFFSDRRVIPKDISERYRSQALIDGENMRHFKSI